MTTPQVTPGPLEPALRLLANGTMAVLGPAADGGFWLLGLQRPDPALVLGVPKSTARTGAVQLARLAGAGLRRPGCRAMSMWTVLPTRMLSPGRSPASRFAAVLLAVYSA